MINSTERSDILVFNCYLCHVRFCLFFVCSTKIGEISDISKCFENFVSQALGVLTRIYAAELREFIKRKKLWLLYKYFFSHTKKAIKKQGCTLLYKYKEFSGVVVKVDEKHDVDKAIAEFRKVKGVTSVNKDGIMQLQ